MPSTSDLALPPPGVSDTEIPADEASLPFDLAAFVSRQLSVSMDDATRLLVEWMGEQRHATAPDLYNY